MTTTGTTTPIAAFAPVVRPPLCCVGLVVEVMIDGVIVSVDEAGRSVAFQLSWIIGATAEKLEVVMRLVIRYKDVS